MGDEVVRGQGSGVRGSDPLRGVAKLAALARGEKIPQMNVDMDVVLRGQDTGVAGVIFPMAWAAGISAVAAGLLLVITLHVTTGATTSKSVASGTIGNEALFSATKVEMP